MAKRKRLICDVNRRAEIAFMVGRTSVQRRIPYTPNFQDFVEWFHRAHPKRQFGEKVYAAILFVEDLELARAIARRTADIEEAGREAKAVAALKEIAGG
jgi:hypothetical protein